MAFQVGDLVGDYRITGILGRGGMGRVFRVRNLLSDREEAMKVLLPDCEADAELAERFLREIKVHASLDHPNIAVLHAALRSAGHVVMLMELVEGMGLDERLRQGPLEPAEAVHFATQVLAALSFAHARGVIHRDIKPGNIIIGSGGLVKLTDFGIARATGDVRHTSTGVAIGSVHYMSPEQLRAAEVDGRSDLYSLGATLYEAVAGRRPFERPDAYSIMSAHLEQAPVPPSDLVASLPRGLSDAILKAMAKNPAARFQTAEEFRLALPSAAGSAPALDAALLETVKHKLSPWLGPIARVLVDRIARRVQTPAELYRALAAEIPSEADRKAFLASL